MMRTLITLCCVLMVGLTLAPDTAEAKRFGGGASLGKMFSTPKKVRQTPQAAPQSSQLNKSATAGKAKPGMGGMLGGLLAGGMLGALFFGGAFDGIQMMDILIMGVIAFLAFKLFARAKPVQQRPQYAGHPAPESDPQPQAFEPTPLMSSDLASDEMELPGWFNKEAFMEGARGHFGQLQQAWNQNNLEEIRSYCSPEMFSALVEERNALGGDELDNDPVSVMAELVGFREAKEEAQLSVNFYGWMREGTNAQTTEFNEMWHLTRDLSVDNADWFIVGIEQPS